MYLIQATAQPSCFWEKLEEWEGVLKCSASSQLHQKKLCKVPSWVRHRALGHSPYPHSGPVGARMRTARPHGGPMPGLGLREGPTDGEGKVPLVHVGHGTLG